MFATTGELGLTATGALVDEQAHLVGVVGVDYHTSAVTAVLNRSVAGHENYRWAYVVERHSGAERNACLGSVSHEKQQFAKTGSGHEMNN